MGFGGRLVVYLVVLTVGLVLGLASVAAQIAISGWLTRQGYIGNACAHGCGEAWTVTLAGPFLVMAAGGAGLFNRQLATTQVALGMAGAALAYAAALRWSIYGVQYVCVALVFAGLAFLVGRGIARLAGAA